MFPKNWKLDRIQEEIAYVYENTVAKGIGQLEKKPTDLFNKFIGESSNGFDILVEVDDVGNIMNAYPYLR
ncbi:EndoU nuclease [Moheibacter sediminis]|uniref:EndoU nuclease n=2 Tax=Moheibacter sediminis TaxID=1434700 RepID=A0A1W1ZEI8_9FLAO|nr:EndoU nuclease [Moheibacter sediminis]